MTEDEPSSSVEDISEKSAKVAATTAFECNSLKDVSLKALLISIPIAKQLKQGKLGLNNSHSKKNVPLMLLGIRC